MKSLRVFLDKTLQTSVIVFALLLVCASFFIALIPEKRAALLTPVDGWVVSNGPGSTVPLAAYPKTNTHLRDSVLSQNGAAIKRSYTPDSGNTAVEVLSPPFKATRFMSVSVTGSEKSKLGGVRATIECIDSKNSMSIFRGSVNNNLVEALVAIPRGWCMGESRLHLVSPHQGNYVGIGSVFRISALSYVKSSFLGQLPFYVSTIFTIGLVLFAGACAGVSTKRHESLIVPISFAFFGLVSLALFYAHHFSADTRYSSEWLLPALGSVLISYIAIQPKYALQEATRILYPYISLWIVVGLVCFSVMGLGYNGLSHWEPNYRFWPASWSSDNELPWLFAEAIRNGSDLKNLFGGGWLPTDRPPLMAGAYLLLSDIFRLLQSNNDGRYLEGVAYNAAAVAMNSIWAPVLLWMLKEFAKWLTKFDRKLLIAFVACVPFIFFNSNYGWPKAFGAAFALLSFGLAIKSIQHQMLRTSWFEVALFFVLGALSMLAHASTALFLAPVGALYLLCNFKKVPLRIALGFSISLGVLVSWSSFKTTVLPSLDPVTKFALTGDYGFDKPTKSLLEMLRTRYGEFSFFDWINIKKVMLQQAFLPIDHRITQLHLNEDFGATWIDNLRAWDFLLLSRGNLVIPILTVIALWIGGAVKLNDAQHYSEQLKPFYILLLSSIAAWLMLVIGFLAPAVLHHWPQAAVIGLVISGAVITITYVPRIFVCIAVCSGLYWLIVWLINPLGNVLAIDWGAALVLALICLFQLFLLRDELTKQRERVYSEDGYALRSKVNVGLSSFLNKGKPQSNRLIWWESAACFCLLLVAFAIFTGVAIFFIAQPLIDSHAFRQTQTAITAFWMLENGFKFQYETPILGYPWTLPFEFPLYQALVALLTAISGLPLEIIGRLVSYLSLAMCAWPAWKLSVKFELPKNTFFIFCALLWTSPLYIYWGRAFMIETTALFLILAALPYGIDVMRQSFRTGAVFGFLSFATLAVLQKATTAGPVLLWLILVTCFYQYRLTGWQIQTLKRVFAVCSVFAIPLVVGVAWSVYTDKVKQMNPLTDQLTSSALATWNFGTINQKASLEAWASFFVERSMSWIGVGAFGILISLLAFTFTASFPKHYRTLVASCLALFVLPLLIFTNLHFIHDYYQISCAVFLIASVSIVISLLPPNLSRIPFVAPGLTAILMLTNLGVLSSAYGYVVSRKIDEQDPKSVQAFRVAQYLRDNTSHGSALLIYGFGYSSEIPYHAHRKAIVVPDWLSKDGLLWREPERYLGGLDLSAIVLCHETNPATQDVAFPTRVDLHNRASGEANWRFVSVYGCDLLLKAS